MIEEYPKFYTTGDPDGNFYVLSYTECEYLNSWKDQSGDAILTLNYSPSIGFSKYSFTIYSTTGKLFAYSRGDDSNPSVGKSLIKAVYDYQIMPHMWKIYPTRKIKDSLLNQEERAKYEYYLARQELCQIFYTSRTWVRMAHRQGLKPMTKPRDWNIESLFEISQNNKEVEESFLQ